MGRRKITIRPILDHKLRHTTFNKRKNGLIKKAAELSMLCDLKLLLIFEDTAGSLIQYSTHNVFNQFQYFQNSGDDRVVQFTPQDYPNFFKVNHYKKGKVEEKIEEKEKARLDKIKQQPFSFPKLKFRKSGHDSNRNDEFNLHCVEGDKMMLEPGKNISSETIDTHDADALHMLEVQPSDPKKKNIKNLQINIPNKTKPTEYQTSGVKQENAYANIASNNLKLQSPQTNYIHIPSPFKQSSPLLSKSASKIAFPSVFAKSSTKLNDPSNIFNFDGMIYNSNYDHIKTPDLPSYLDPLNSGMQHSNQLQQQKSHQFNSHINLPILPQTQLNNDQRNNPMITSLQQNISNGSFYKPNFFEAESPYLQGFNQKSFYPFMGVSNEEGFSPFLKNNLMFDLSNQNPGSSVARKDRATFFTFKNDNAYNGISGNGGLSSSKNYENNSYTAHEQNADAQAVNHKQNVYYEDRLRPKKKLKV